MALSLLCPACSFTLTGQILDSSTLGHAVCSIHYFCKLQDFGMLLIIPS